MLRGGTTTVVDMYMFEKVVAEECARIGMRAVLGQAMVDFPTPEYKTWDESVQGTREFIQAYAGHPLVVAAVGPHAPYTVSPEHLQECQRLAEEMNCPMVIHLAETQSENQQIRDRYGRSSISHLDHLGLLSNRLIAAHVVWPDDAEIGRLAKTGVGVGHCPQSNAKLACGIAPVVKMLQAGVAVGLGTDGCASNNDLDMWQEMQTANLMQKLHSHSCTVMNARETLHMATLGGARAAHLDHLVGSIEVGKRADMIVVRLDSAHQIPVYDPISQLCYSTKSTDVTQVYIEGNLVMSDGLVPAIDEPELRLAVAEEAARVQTILRRNE
jgi:5-methylthioadenosine/S-adenosylhomocysteine deaminase